METELKARIQHAVEHTESGVQCPADNSIPKNGEIVFNTDRTNFKVGDGTHAYSVLDDFIKTFDGTANGLVPYDASIQSSSKPACFVSAEGEWNKYNLIATNSSSSTASASSTNGHTRINQIVTTAGGTGKSVTGSINLQGSGNVTVTSDSTGVVTIYGSSGVVSMEVGMYGGLDTNDKVRDSDGNYHALNGSITGTTETPLNTSQLNLVAGDNITFGKLVEYTDSNSVSGLVINVPIYVATSGTNGKLVVYGDASSTVPLYTEDTAHVSVPIYYTDSYSKDGATYSSDIHYVNVYDIVAAIKADEELRNAFNEALKNA